MKNIIFFIAISTFLNFTIYSQKIVEPFEFQFENKTLRGLIEKPKNKKSKAIVVIIPGYGKTNFVAGNWFAKLRDNFVNMGLTVVFWDKIGCGKSEGEFNAQQPVENSAEEAFTAIKKIKELNITGSDKIGLWGLSRAGWICPLINEKIPIDFWISVSGTDDKENFGYLLKSNLIIAGKSEKEATKLYDSWMLGHKIFTTNGSYRDYVKATKPLSKDKLAKKLFGFKKVYIITKKGRNNYLKNQKLYTSRGYFDTESGLWVYLNNFDKVLNKINAPVLALFGRQDSQVDWRKTKKLYEKTIGKNANSDLTTKVFDNCNHSLQKCKTCGYQEDLSSLNWAACDGYYTTMENWLRHQKIIE